MLGAQVCHFKVQRCCVEGRWSGSKNSKVGSL
jgi:hypothetical protein